MPVQRQSKLRPALALPHLAWLRFALPLRRNAWPAPGYALLRRCDAKLRLAIAMLR